MSHTNTLRLDDYANVAAHIAHYGPDERPRLLTQLRVSQALWAESEAHWIGALLGDDETTDDVAGTFAAQFTAARARLAATRPPLESLEPLLPEPTIGAPFSPVDETGWAVEVGLPALPFADEEAAPPPLAAVDASLAGDTAFVQALQIAAPATPFERTTSRAALRERFSLAHYASLVAELSCTPNGAAEIRARYGLAGSEEVALHATYAELFASSPNERTRFDTMVSEYMCWLGHGGGRS